MRKAFSGMPAKSWIIAHTIALFLLLFSASLFADLSTSVDRNRLAEGETLNLMLEVQGQVTGQPDTKPLEKDFEVLGTASGSQMTITNGVMDARTTWTISLLAKHSGKIIIPPLEINGEKSRAINVEVTKAPQADANSGADIFIESEVVPKSPYVQGEVRYAVRIYHAVRLAEAELNEPVIDGVLIRKLESDREYMKTINDRRYRVVERNYALFPQSSGELVIPAPVLNARVRQQGQRSRSFGGFFGDDPFDMFSRSHSVRVRGDSHTLQVRPRPVENKGANWLPAKHLSLTEEWDIPEKEIRVGEPITRLLKLTADGLTAAQLPDMNVPGIDGLKSYPDKAQKITQDSVNGVIGEKKQRIAFVPAAPGVFTLPALEIYWWDTRTDQQQRVELPARSFTILPAEGVTTAPLKADSVSPIESPLVQVADARKVIKSAGFWPWIALVSTLLWLSTLALWFRDRVASTKEKTNTPEPESHNNQKSVQKAFMVACRTNEPQAARNRLLEWAGLHWPNNPPHGLSDLAERFEQSSARQALLELNRVLYRGEGGSWNGAVLEKAINKLPKKSPGPSTSGILPPFYPRE